MKSFLGYTKPVFVKRLRCRQGAGSDFAQMFEREALLAVQLEHPSIGRVFDFGRLSSTDYFMAVERVAGRSLRQLSAQALHGGNPLPLWFTLRITREVCEALHFIHTFNKGHRSQPALVHGDVTPDTIMVSYQGFSKVLDFGIARTRLFPPQPLAHQLTAKCAYEAPERLRGETGDPRSDVYSVGVVLYELLTGVKPFVASDKAALHGKIQRAQLTTPATMAPWVPKIVDDLVMGALAAHPLDRCCQVSHLAEDIDAVLEELGDQRERSEIASLVNELSTDQTEGAPPASRIVRLREALVPPSFADFYSHQAKAHHPSTIVDDQVDYIEGAAPVSTRIRRDSSPELEISCEEIDEALARALLSAGDPQTDTRRFRTRGRATKSWASPGSALYREQASRKALGEGGQAAPPSRSCGSAPNTQVPPPVSGIRLKGDQASDPNLDIVDVLELDGNQSATGTR